MSRAPDLMSRAPAAGCLVDALSDVLRVIRLSGGVFLEANLTAPWCFKGRISPEDCKAFQVAPSLVIATHFVVSGQMLLRVEDGEPIVVREGELRSEERRVGNE